MLFTILYTLVLIALILAAISPKLLKKVAVKTLIAIIAIALIAGALAIPGIVRAESDITRAVVDITYIEAANKLLIVHFDYEGQDLAFYWYGELEIKPIYVTIGENYEVILADYYCEERYGSFFTK